MVTQRPVACILLSPTQAPELLGKQCSTHGREPQAPKPVRAGTQKAAFVLEEELLPLSHLAEEPRGVLRSLVKLPRD